MSVLWDHISAAKATGGRAVGTWDVRGLSIDTRSLAPGDMFIALKDIRDGHDFIPQALEAGAAAVLSSKPMDDVPALIVDDTMTALEALGAYSRQRCDAARIGVTGSVGKTSVKEMLADVLTGFGQTHRSVKSFNNHWGVPLTLARMPHETQFGVFEMGMNHAGELTTLSGFVQPEIAVMTTIALAHAEFFQGIEDIADAKAEIFTGMRAGGLAILPLDNAMYPRLERAAIAARLNIVTFGEHASADFRISNYRGDAVSGFADISVFGKSRSLSLSQPGLHTALNALIVLAVCHQLDLDLERAVLALGQLGGIAGRGKQHRLRLKGVEYTLIDDSYNANPASMRAALQVLGMRAPKNKGRKIAVLGDMLELGEDSIKHHRELAAPLIASGCNAVIGCGAMTAELLGTLPKDIQTAVVSSHEAVLDALSDWLRAGDVVLIKGSNGSGVHRVVSKLIQNNEKEVANAV